MSMANGKISVEWPDTHHPAFDDMADGVRALMSDGRHHGALQYAHVSRPPMAAFREPMGEFSTEATVGIERRILTIHRAAGPAPYVGRAFVYEWEIAADEFGRWISGPASMHFTESEVEFWIRAIDAVTRRT